MTPAQDDGKVVNLKHRPPLLPVNAPGTHFCYRLSRSQGHSAIGGILCHWKIPMTPAGSEPATVRFVAQHLNHCAIAVTPAFCSTFDVYVQKRLFFCGHQRRDLKADRHISVNLECCQQTFCCHYGCCWSLLYFFNSLLLFDLQFVCVIYINRGRNFKENFSI